MTIRTCFIFVIILGSLYFQSCSSGGSSLSTDDPERAYFIAKSNYDKKDYLSAIDDFNLIKLKFSGSSVIDKAIYYLGMSYYKRKEFILANYEFETLIKNYPSSSLAEDARYMLAMCYFGLSPVYNLDQTYTRYAIVEFQNFLDLYPGSKYAAETERRIQSLKSKLAFKSLKSAELYFKLGKFKSALVYYNNVINEFYDTKYADDAMYGKIQALIKKKQYEDAKAEISEFEDKFPGSTLLRSVLNLKSQIPY
jgi:outer membrane protein assembly factor BamD